MLKLVGASTGCVNYLCNLCRLSYWKIFPDLFATQVKPNFVLWNFYELCSIDFPILPFLFHFNEKKKKIRNKIFSWSEQKRPKNPKISLLSLKVKERAGEASKQSDQASLTAAVEKFSNFFHLQFYLRKIFFASSSCCFTPFVILLLIMSLNSAGKNLMRRRKKRKQ